MNLRSVLRFLGRLLLLLAVAQVIPVFVCLIYREYDHVLAFFVASLATGAFGLLLAFLGRGTAGQELYRREGILIVVGGWFFASLFGALPYLFSGVLSFFPDALFESASGFTTTGATVLLDIEAAGRGVLFWRSFSQWLGGMGIIVLFVALLPEIIPGARFLFKMEVPGPTAETLHPRVRDTAIVLWKIYLLLTAAEILFLWLLGLDLYDAFTHTFSTVSTGGFSPRSASTAGFSPWVQGVLILFMVLSGVNFSLFYAGWQGRWRTLYKDPELRLYLVLVGGVSVVITIDLLLTGVYESVPRAAFDALFQVSSMITTTGFVTADFDAWPLLSRVLLMALMFVGACAGSTSGSMKVARMLIGLKYAFREVGLVFSPNRVKSIFMGGKVVPDSVVRSVSGFFILFITAWGIGAILLSFGDGSIVTSATASITVLGNAGPGLEAVGPEQSFAHFGAAQKLLMVFLMLLGRLEMYAIAAVCTARFWKD